MKKIIIIFAALISFTIFSAVVLQTPSDILYLLNWGEYIDTTLIEKFEKENNCQVVMEMVISSEAMYQKISSQTSSYDVAIPGDYTVQQLYCEGLLKEADVNNPDYSYLSQYKTAYNDSLSNLMSNYMRGDDNEEFNSYYFPYFWGAYSMIYNFKNPEVEEVIENNGFAALYNRDLYQTQDVGIGMYKTARWIVASYLMSKGLNPNIVDSEGNLDGDLSEDLQNEIINSVRNASFTEFGEDNLKRDVVNELLDLCFTQSGDFFNALYLVYDGGIAKNGINFFINTPKTTAAFFDSMVIPTTCQNYTLANKFINFMMNPDNAYQNAIVIGYSPTMKDVATRYAEAADNGEYYFESEECSLTMEDFLNNYPMFLNPLYGVENAYIFEPKSQAYLTTCETIFNSLA